MGDKMISFRELKRYRKKVVDGKCMNVSVLGDCSTQYLVQALEGYFRYVNIDVSIYEADYNQIKLQLLDENSETYKSDPRIIVLYQSVEHLYEEFVKKTIDERLVFAEDVIDDIRGNWSLIANNSHAQILQFNFCEYDDMTLGQYANKTPSSFIFQLRKLNYLLQVEAANNNLVNIVDILGIQNQLGKDVFFDATLFYNSKVTISFAALPYVAKRIVDIVLQMQGKMKKCLVCDLDNTLWGGVVGDDGIENLEMGELGRGRIFTSIQSWVKELKQKGIIIAICSKNNEELAKEVFIRHPEMVLQLEDISAFVANWEDKATNIKYIQESLNIGLDSMVFIDDNPFERNLVREILPEVEVPELPDDPSLYLEYLINQNYFETLSYMGEKSDRTQMYRAEFSRKKEEKTFANVADYLRSLEMVAEAKRFDSENVSRISQLTQRSNQFNLRTIRYTTNDIEVIMNDENYLTFYFKLRDKYGEYGIVSLVIVEKIDSEQCFLDTWIMSCRVLKRGMEEFVMNRVVESLKEHGYKYLKSEYIPTTKNAMVQNIFVDMGFREIGEREYELAVNSYIPLETFIMEEKQ